MIDEIHGDLGILLSNGCRVIHGGAANVKTPFPEIPLVMHELHSGRGNERTSFKGQFGFIRFEAGFRLPRHVHMHAAGGGMPACFVAERIMVLNGIGMMELNGEVYVVAPGSLVEIARGVPHTWTACPPGVTLPDQTVSDGTFLMIYEYSEPTSFYPVTSTASLADPAEYHPYTGNLEAIRFPELDVENVLQTASCVWDRKLRPFAEVSA